MLLNTDYNPNSRRSKANNIFKEEARSYLNILTAILQIKASNSRVFQVLKTY